MSSHQLRRRRDAAAAAWEQWQGGLDIDLRRDVSESWQRSASRVSLNIDGAPSEAEDTIREQWLHSDLRVSVERFTPQLNQIAEDGSFVVAVTNADAAILWTSGSRHMRARAERANFAPGGKWDEVSVGTNALDLALRTRNAQTVFSAEHFAPLVHQWVCYSAPINDPRTGRLLGVLDLSTTWDHAHPLAMSTTVALANLLERDLSTIELRTGMETLRLNLMGTASAELNGQRLALSRRQFEICGLLATHPRGMSLESLHAKLYGDETVSLSTVKAEVSHLRQVLGGRIASRPYRLELSMQCDVSAVMTALENGKFGTAMESYGGELLAMSESPSICELRNWIEVALRAAALHSTDIEALARFVDTHPYDLAVAEHLSRLVSQTDARFAGVAARLERARLA